MSTENLLTVPPHDETAEQRVIGAILRRSDVMERVMAEVEPTDFYRESFRTIYAAMVTLFENKTAIEDGLLKAVIGEKEWERIQGWTLCSEAVAMVGESVTAPQYAREIRNRSIQRAAIEFGREVAALATDAPGPGNWTSDWTEEMVANIEYGVAQITCRETSPPDPKLATVASGVIYGLEHKLRKGVLTGIRNIDHNFGGFVPGDISIIGGRTSRGKTAIAANFALNIAESGVPVAYFSLEMNRDAMVERCLSTLGQVDMFEAKREGLTAERMERLRGAEARLNAMPLEIIYRPALQPRKFRMEAKRLIREMGMKFAVVDYFGLMHGDVRDRDRVREMREIIITMQDMAKELDISILMLTQINREGAHEAPPDLSNLRETGASEETADNVFLLWQKPLGKDQAEYRADEWQPIDLIVGKQRNGPAGITIKLEFRKQWGAFIDG